MKYVIGEDGIPRGVVAENSNLSNEATECILWLFRERLKYDPNRSGNMTIVYPNEGARNGAPKWEGTVAVKYVIGEDGTVKAFSEEIPPGSDKAIANCVFDVFRELKYPASHGGNVNVMYTIQFGT